MTPLACQRAIAVSRADVALSFLRTCGQKCPELWAATQTCTFKAYFGLSAVCLSRASPWLRPTKTHQAFCEDEFREEGVRRSTTYCEHSQPSLASRSLIVSMIAALTGQDPPRLAPFRLTVRIAGYFSSAQDNWTRPWSQAGPSQLQPGTSHLELR